MSFRAIPLRCLPPHGLFPHTPPGSLCGIAGNLLTQIALEFCGIEE
jgi:hypothetical protein